MKKAKVNVVLDESWGSSGKGKLAAYLADKFGVEYSSSSNYPNAGHTVAFQSGYKFVAKAIPTAVALKHEKGMGITGLISPGSGFDPKQLFKEWVAAGKPKLIIHSRASVVTEEHAKREREGAESTKHIASTMQGSGTAISDKVLRKSDVLLAGTVPLDQWNVGDVDPSIKEEFLERVQVIDAYDFRTLTHSLLDAGTTWLHEGSQGYALSIDHGTHYPQCTSRNCTVQAAMDHLAVPAQRLGDVYLNMRSFPIRVGNVVEGGNQLGYSGDFPPDAKELTWAEVAQISGMPPEEAKQLTERERTTVTKRIRRVATRSDSLLVDAVRTNGATKLAMNFVQYWNWKDAGLKGGKSAYAKLSNETRTNLDHIEQLTGLKVTIIGTGALHDEVIDIDE